MSWFSGRGSDDSDDSDEEDLEDAAKAEFFGISKWRGSTGMARAVVAKENRDARSVRDQDSGRNSTSSQHQAPASAQASASDRMRTPALASSKVSLSENMSAAPLDGSWSRTSNMAELFAEAQGRSSDSITPQMSASANQSAYALPLLGATGQHASVGSGGLRDDPTAPMRSRDVGGPDLARVAQTSRDLESSSSIEDAPAANAVSLTERMKQLRNLSSTKQPTPGVASSKALVLDSSRTHRKSPLVKESVALEDSSNSLGTESSSMLERSSGSGSDTGAQMRQAFRHSGLANEVEPKGTTWMSGDDNGAFANRSSNSMFTSRSFDSAPGAHSGAASSTTSVTGLAPQSTTCIAGNLRTDSVTGLIYQTGSPKASEDVDERISKFEAMHGPGPRMTAEPATDSNASIGAASQQADWMRNQSTDAATRALNRSGVGRSNFIQNRSSSFADSSASTPNSERSQMLTDRRSFNQNERVTFSGVERRVPVAKSAVAEPDPSEILVEDLLMEIGKLRKWTQTEIQDDLRVMKSQRLRTMADLMLLSATTWKELMIPGIVKDSLRAADQKALRLWGYGQQALRFVFLQKSEIAAIVIMSDSSFAWGYPGTSVALARKAAGYDDSDEAPTSVPPASQLMTQSPSQAANTRRDFSLNRMGSGRQQQAIVADEHAGDHAGRPHSNENSRNPLNNATSTESLQYSLMIAKQVVTGGRDSDSNSISGSSQDRPRQTPVRSESSQLRMIPDFSKDDRFAVWPNSMAIGELLLSIGSERNWTAAEMQSDRQAFEKQRIRTVGDLRAISDQTWDALTSVLPIVKDLVRHEIWRSEEN
ncbi:hypothetical protein HK105_202719 [Polyrhizophydium stewartii]|uniref:Uncharacterized protein n=1 Tax=Polyrhizophydium stewartii TaxID=2732419 RepID=A0ABR4NE97_9FUNG